MVKPARPTMAECFLDKKSGISQLIPCCGVGGKYGHVAQEAVAPSGKGGRLTKSWSSRSKGVEWSAPMDSLQLRKERDVVRQ